MMCINPIAWKLKATDGYKLSKPIEGKSTHLLYVDDMKIFAASQSKLDRVLSHENSHGRYRPNLE